MIPRFYESLETYLAPNRVLILYGPRRVGKTTLLNAFLERTPLKYRLETGDDILIHEVLGSQRVDLIQRYAQGYQLIAIDEAQRVPNIGMGLKILVDYVPDLQVIAAGSASLDLATKIGEPLTGRTTTLHLYPIAHLELARQINQYDLIQRLPEFLVFGAYPEVVEARSHDQKAAYLREITHAYLLKDVLEIERVKSSKILLDLLRLLAFQVGSEVSYAELGGQLGIDSKTVARYLDLFEKAFVLLNLRGFSLNLRKEVTKKSKYYFYDNGIRNAIISNFNDLILRDDVGRLWENFLVGERLKKQAYQRIYANNYFWRTWDQQEVDFVEEREGKLYGYEFKYSSKKSGRFGTFLSTYPEATVLTVTRENYLDFISRDPAETVSRRL